MKGEQVFDRMNEWGLKKKPFVFVLNFDGSSGNIIELVKAAEEGIYFDILEHRNHNFNHLSLPSTWHFVPKPLDYRLYLKAYQKVLHHLFKGNSYLVNLTFQSKIETNLSLEQLFIMAHAPYKMIYKNLFTVFSPEPFVTISNKEISSFPMKGTINNKVNNAKNLIINNPKEQAEHATIVDLIRNDLSRIAFNVEVLRYRYIQEVKTSKGLLLQVSSEIKGTLKEEFLNNYGDIIRNLLPAGSVTGAPKEKTIDIINKTENYKRGYYTGIFGLYTGKEFLSAVMIRFVELNALGLFYKSGGGITVNSNPIDEYNELISKIYVPIG